MKLVNLNIIYKDIWTIKTISRDKNISNFLNRILKNTITIEDNKIISLFNIKTSKKLCFIIIDSNYNLLDLKSKVPNKFMILCIDTNILNQQTNNYNQKDIISLKDYLYNTYKIDIFPNIELPLEKDNNKQIKVSKDTINKIIKPSIIEYSIKQNIKKIIIDRVIILNKTKIKNKKQIPKKIQLTNRNTKITKKILVKINIYNKKKFPKKIKLI